MQVAPQQAQQQWEAVLEQQRHGCAVMMRVRAGHGGAGQGRARGGRYLRMWCVHVLRRGRGMARCVM